jgi:hypothetical protein
MAYSYKLLFTVALWEREIRDLESANLEWLDRMPRQMDGWMNEREELPLEYQSEGV